MCRTCRYEGTKLIFSTRDPDETPVEYLPPITMSKEMHELFDMWNRTHTEMQDVYRYQPLFSGI